MENTLFSKQIRSRVPLCCGSRAALVFESELPAGDTPLACHLREVAQTLFAHAERVWLPRAEAELIQLSKMGRGYDFTPHRVCFKVGVQQRRGRVQLMLLLQYTDGTRPPLVQRTRQIWSAGGEWRLR